MCFRGALSCTDGMILKVVIRACKQPWKLKGELASMCNGDALCFLFSEN
jgi:hypothetical protein